MGVGTGNVPTHRPLRGVEQGTGIWLTANGRVGDGRVVANRETDAVGVDRKPGKRDVQPDDFPETLKPTSIRLPYYVRARAEEYLLDHPQMRFRHLAMAALKELGIEVNDEDLVAERQNVLAVARVQQDPCRG